MFNFESKYKTNMVPMEEEDTHADAELSGDDDSTKKMQGMAGMADIINKILQKPLPDAKGSMLVKSKTLKKRKLETRNEALQKKKHIKERLLEREKNHVIPTRSNAQNEVLLKKIATKGVVKLFNAVSIHQKTMSDKMKEANTESKKEKAVASSSKSTFMDILKQPEKKKNQRIKDDDNDDDDDESKWDVLREDFMMGASMKDWDKQTEESDEESMSEIDSS